MKMAKMFFAGIFIFSFVVNSSCSKSSSSPSSNNPVTLVLLAGSWFNPAWGGTNGDTIRMNINSNSAKGTITKIGSPSYNFSSGEVILSNIVVASNGNSYTCNGIFKYGNGNANTANTTGTITYNTSDHNEITVQLAPSNGVTPPPYVYKREI
ncbi:MAG: hypothetical protein JST75_14200 [Bacteroidetes bacterium]|nr:hypothetical protein [Bacteroidota bacterium]